MRMNCDRPMGEIKPYEILVRYRDKYGAGDYSAWGNWRLSSAHQTESGRDDAYLKLHDSDIKQYKPHLNESEYRAQRTRLDHKTDETDIAGALADPSGAYKESEGVDPDDGVVTYREGFELLSNDLSEHAITTILEQLAEVWRPQPSAKVAYHHVATTGFSAIEYTQDENGVTARWIEL